MLTYSNSKWNLFNLKIKKYILESSNCFSLSCKEKQEKKEKETMVFRRRDYSLR